MKVALTTADGSVEVEAKAVAGQWAVHRPIFAEGPRPDGWVVSNTECGMRAAYVGALCDAHMILKSLAPLRINGALSKHFIDWGRARGQFSELHPKAQKACNEMRKRMLSIGYEPRNGYAKRLEVST